MIAKPISIKDAERKFGGCAQKAVELTSGDPLQVAETRHYHRERLFEVKNAKR